MPPSYYDFGQHNLSTGSVIEFPQTPPTTNDDPQYWAFWLTNIPRYLALTDQRVRAIEFNQRAIIPGMGPVFAQLPGAWIIVWQTTTLNQALELFRARVYKSAAGIKLQIFASDGTIVRGTTETLSAQATDPDGNPLYGVSMLAIIYNPDGTERHKQLMEMSGDRITFTLAFTPQQTDQTGYYGFELRATLANLTADSGIIPNAFLVT